MILVFMISFLVLTWIAGQLDVHRQWEHCDFFVPGRLGALEHSLEHDEQTEDDPKDQNNDDGQEGGHLDGAFLKLYLSKPC